MKFSKTGVLQNKRFQKKQLDAMKCARAEVKKNIKSVAVEINILTVTIPSAVNFAEGFFYN